MYVQTTVAGMQLCFNRELPHLDGVALHHGPLEDDDQQICLP